ncbi:Short-chain dehydrogenase/reductase SDR [Corchorus olitorius]|uniref:Short-chain dehydrogenase/reductase SDR n=1 Tax=Corchorus olitorius TaxID=93759 RepID=A0A1R3JGA2_9ROSI|nr:Short-chain dehydrogenase/reductase SDR [Corchorus olitorius]
MNMEDKLISSENVAGKVVLVTGAASGIGEQISYEYARRRARLVLVDIRGDRLGRVVRNVKNLGSPDVIAIAADVSKVEDCKRFIDETVKHFGQLDHLVNNAGIARLKLFEEDESVSEFPRDVNFWGTVYGTHFAIPHLRKSYGKIIVIASGLGKSSKAALISFYETLRCEIGWGIGITIVTPGLINSELTQTVAAKAAIGFLDFVPMASSERCGKAIVRSACRGDKYLTEPSWIKSLYLLKILCPELIEYTNHIALMKNLKKTGNQ